MQSLMKALKQTPGSEGNRVMGFVMRVNNQIRAPATDSASTGIISEDTFDDPDRLAYEGTHLGGKTDHVVSGSRRNALYQRNGTIDPSVPQKLVVCKQNCPLNMSLV